MQINRRNIFFVLTMVVSCFVNIMAQPINLDTRGKSWSEVLASITDQCQCQFAYSRQHLTDAVGDYQFVAIPLQEVLNKIVEAEGLQWKKIGDMIVIGKRSDIARSEKSTLSGYIINQENGEALIGATLYSPISNNGTSSNSYGFYSITLPRGRYHFVVNHLGYEPMELQIDLLQDQEKTLSLRSQETVLTEVVVSATPDLDAQVGAPHVRREMITSEIIKNTPAVMGESDLIKVVQLSPGVATQGEGSSSIFVRGGGADQNLILLDDVPVYNPSHLMGFFSVFNADAINGLDFYRGGIPSNFGGRLSSVLDIRMKEGNNQRFGAEGGIGTLSSRLLLEAPIKKDRSSFMISGRRTYADLFLKLSQDEFTRKTTAYFYDVNAKFNTRIGEKDRLYISGYFGHDINRIRSLQYGVDWGNTTTSVRWNHLYGNKLFSNTTLLYSKYTYRIDLSRSNSNVNWNSAIEDIGLKHEFNWYPNQKHKVYFGLHSTLHHLKPGFSEDEIPNVQAVPASKSLEHRLFIGDDFTISNKISASYGLHASLFQLIGTGERILFTDDGIQDLQDLSKGRVYYTFGGLEPRVNFNYRTGQRTSLALNYQRTRQYFHLLSNASLSFNVFDIWIPASSQAKPQIADQVALGIERFDPKGMWKLSADIYYKQLKNQIEYRNHAHLLMNRYLEAEVLSARGKAYGFEAQIKKEKGNTTGWLNYTYARTLRKTPDLNAGSFFPANFDQPHQLQISARQRISNRLSLAVNWVFHSGQPITLPIGTFQYEGLNPPLYADRNNGRLPDYHRLDLSFTLRNKDKPGRKKEAYWIFGLYNAYHRLNASTAFVSPQLEDIDLISDRNKTGYYQLSIFGILPSVSYNFKF